jgi:hypothetical protein
MGNIKVKSPVVAWSPDHATPLTAGLLFLGIRETFGQDCGVVMETIAFITGGTE